MPNRPTRMLVVCTANQCRSPMAEGLLRRAFGGRPDWEVSSAGTSAGDGIPATADAVATMAAAGIDISGHRSRRLTRELLADADLVLTMERAHARHAVVLDPSAFERTFVLKDFAARAAATALGADPGAWVALLGAGRRREDLLRGTSADDVSDPIGQGRKAYERTAQELDRLLTSFR